MPNFSFFIFCLMFLVVSFGVAAMAALIPSIALYFGVPQEFAFRLTWLYMLPYGVCALFWAPLTRVIKVKRIFLFTTLGFFLSTLLFSLSGNIYQAFLFRLLMGCFGCSFVPLVLIIIAKTVSGPSKSKYIGTFFALSYVSTFVSVFLSGFIHWRIIYLIPAVLSLIVFCLMLFGLDDFDFRKEKFQISYIQTFKDKQAIRFFIAVMLGSFFYHSLQQRLGVYLNQAYSLQQVVISSLFTVATLGAMSFEFLGGFLGSRFGNIRIARVGFFLMSIFVFSLLIINRYELMFLFIALWGSGWALTHVGLSSHLTHLPDKVLRDASSLNSALRFSFGGLGAFVGGLLVSAIGFESFFVIVALMILVLGVSLNRIVNYREECHG